jgi:hypothetical protein
MENKKEEMDDFDELNDTIVLRRMSGDTEQMMMEANKLILLGAFILGFVV